MGTWSTWEELLLGAAVLRHGTRDWATVAAELRARALYPYTFTPEVCRAKYDDLQQHYDGCTTWFEEVRKKRMAELRHALEVSEDSIGSLETKLETLKAEKEGEALVNYAFSQTESPVATRKSEGFESFSKESKDGLSAGSFTLETRMSWSTGGQFPHDASAEEETKPGVVRPTSSSDQEKTSSTIIENLLDNMQGATLKKRRGQRKRKDCGVEESGFVEKSTAEVSGSLLGPKRDDIDDLLRVFNSIVEHKCASTFRHRLDSQKRGRYKQMIRRHVDFDTLRSRIIIRSITTVTELFRDLLLLTNNAMVFYSNSTREYKSAAILRDLVSKTLREHFDGSNRGNAKTTTTSISPTVRAAPAKPKSVVVVGQHGMKSLATKMSSPAISQPKRVGGKSNVEKQSASPVKGRKRIRTM